MAKVLLEAWFGSERAYGKAASLGVMFVPKAGSGEREVFLATARNNAVNVLKNTDFAAYPGKIDDFGKWRQGMFNVEEGTVVRVKATRSAPHGSMNIAASLFIAPREGAALRQITFRATAGTGCYREEYHVRGRFDILTKEQVEDHAGEFPRWMAGELSERQVRAAFVITEVSPEIAARPVKVTTTIANSSGKAVKVEVQQNTRRVKL